MLLLVIGMRPLMLFDGIWHKWISLSTFHFFITKGFIFYVTGFILLSISLLFGSKKWYALGLKLIVILTFWLVAFFVNPAYASNRYSAIDAIEKIEDQELYAVVHSGQESNAYSLVELMYYHVINDRIDNRDLLISYCGMCRSLRVFEPVINGKQLHFTTPYAYKNNALLEDRETGSWWLQSTGECIFGELKGEKLKEYGGSYIMKGSVINALGKIDLKTIDKQLDPNALNRLPRYRKKLQSTYSDNIIWFRSSERFHQLDLNVFNQEHQLEEVLLPNNKKANIVQLDEFSYAGFLTADTVQLYRSEVYGRPVILDHLNHRWNILGEPIKDHPPLENINLYVEKPFTFNRFIQPSTPTQKRAVGPQ